MKKFHILILSFCLLFFGSISKAEEYFQWTIKHVYTVTNSGELETSGFQNNFEDNTFTVSRISGAIIGQTLTTILANKVSVINPGSTENSFKAIAEFKEQVQVIEIQFYSKVEQKPFVAISMGGAGIVTGICTYKE